jgi:hypothetical protein
VKFLCFDGPIIAAAEFRPYGGINKLAAKASACHSIGFFRSLDLHTTLLKPGSRQLPCMKKVYWICWLLTIHDDNAHNDRITFRVCREERPSIVPAVVFVPRFRNRGPNEGVDL